MATKKTKRAKVVPIAEALGEAMGHSVEAGLAATTGKFSKPKRVEELPEPGTEIEDEEPEPVKEPKAGKPKPPTKAEITAARRRTSPKLAAKRVALCVRTLEQHDWTTIGVDGINGAIAILRSALPKLEAAKAKLAARKFVVGTVTKLAAKSVKRWEGVITADEVLRVVVLRKLSAVIETSDGMRVLLPLRDLERDAS